MTTQIPAKEKSRLAYHSRMNSMTLEESLAFKKRRAEYFKRWYEKKKPPRKYKVSQPYIELTTTEISFRFSE